MEEIGLYYFVSKSKRELDDFKEFWEFMNSLNEEQYPLDLNESEWYEQFIAYLQTGVTN